jgi:hypothetical protein
MLLDFFVVVLGELVPAVRHRERRGTGKASFALSVMLMPLLTAGVLATAPEHIAATLQTITFCAMLVISGSDLDITPAWAKTSPQLVRCVICVALPVVSGAVNGAVAWNIVFSIGVMMATAVLAYLEYRHRVTTDDKNK